jgi:hypothetical protein
VRYADSTAAAQDARSPEKRFVNVRDITALRVKTTDFTLAPGLRFSRGVAIEPRGMRSRFPGRRRRFARVVGSRGSRTCVARIARRDRVNWHRSGETPRRSLFVSLLSAEATQRQNQAQVSSPPTCVGDRVRESAESINPKSRAKAEKLPRPSKSRPKIACYCREHDRRDHDNPADISMSCAGECAGEAQVKTARARV